ncbi:MAG TPA: hypothetical protein VLM16_05100 [Ginsengibacter sp.]|nr:hypothetical protein [Ginsengibacter sp.]
MKKKSIRKILIWTVSSFLFLTLVLAVHIWWVMRPKAPDSHTRIMARLDLKQPIKQTDADKITAWLYHQKGIDHVLANIQTGIVVFTFFPIETSGDKIVDDFKSQLPYKAKRYIPTEDELKSGCPVASTSFTYKVYNYVKNNF